MDSQEPPYAKMPRLERQDGIREFPVWIRRPQQESIIDELPDECLTRIFHLVDWHDRLRAEKVCLRWRRVVRAHGWDYFHTFDSNMASYRMELLGKYTRVLHESASRLPSMMAHFGSTLQELSLRLTEGMARQEPSVLPEILNHCTSVRHLRLQFTYWKSLKGGNVPTEIPMRDSLITLELENCIRVGHLALQLISTRLK
jgi:F-box-like